MEWSQLPYQYETLSPREIRVVVLHPLTSENGIHCDLKRVFIDESPVYEALSYVWGDISDRIPIRVGSGTLEVTQNLYTALRALVHPDTERTIWIDALCINQDDISEKNHQVQFMKDVYARASGVVIWLGPASDNSDTIMEYTGSLDARNAFQEYQKYKVSNPYSWQWSAAELWKLLPISNDNVNKFLSRPWFSRIWVIQEAVVNRETAFLCGARIVSWEQMFSFAWSLLKYRFAYPGLSARLRKSENGIFSIINIQLYRYDKSFVSLLSILLRSVPAEASDPRDRIYAVQNLVCNPSQEYLLLQPDYKADVSEIYTQMAMNFYKAQNHQILDLVGRCKQRIKALPSWAVDWTTRSSPSFATGFMAHGISKICFEISSNGGIHRLTMQGTILSTISATVENPITPNGFGSPSKPTDLKPLRDYVTECIALIGTGLSREKINRNQKGFWRAIVGDDVSGQGTRYPKDYVGSLIPVPELCSSKFSQDRLDISYLSLLHLERIIIASNKSSRQFALSSGDDMCLVPDITRSGDVILIVSGYHKPIVVRAVEENLYEIIGDCYVHEYMDGEAFSEDPGRPFQEFVFC